MRVLLISDTHGDVDAINRLTRQYRADACIHAGDWGMFLPDSLPRLSADEIRKMVTHSALSKEEQFAILSGSREVQEQAILEHGILGTFEDYYNHSKTLDVPVYAVWGNHEDVSVIESVIVNPIPNLTLLRGGESVLIDGVRLYGLGGDFTEKHLPMAKKLGIPMVKDQAKSAFWQYRELIDNVDRLPEGERRIQVTHADPKEEPLLALLAWRCGAELTISGHMHRHEVADSWTRPGDEPRMLARLEELKAKFPRLDWAGFEPETLSRPIRHLNLPGTKQGHAVMEIGGGIWRIE